MLVADGGAGVVTGAVTDSASHPYTLLRRANTAASGVGGTVELWCSYLPSASVGLKVTATVAGATAPGANLTVKVLVGAKPTQPGASAGAGSTSRPASLAITTTTTGSRVYGAIINYASSTAYTLNGSTSNVDVFPDTTNGDWYAAFKANAATGTPGAITLGYTNTGAATNIALAEILPALAAGSGRSLFERQAVFRAGSF